MIIYIAGPMTGIPEHNFPAFFAAEEFLKEMFPDAQIVNPARLDDGDTSKGWVWYMRRDIRLIADCTHVVFLPGWRDSKGANLEYLIGTALEMDLRELVDGEVGPMRERAIDEAKRLVYGDRGANYGHPFQDYSKTSALWSVILGKEVTAEQAVLCMIAVKISREVNLPKRDNRVDMIGYAECLERINSLSEDERRTMLEEVGL